MSLYLLWTDILVWLLVVVMATSFWRMMRSPLARERWYRIFHAKVAVASAIVLGFYVVIALSDSIHFKSTDSGYGNQIVSLLDMAMVHRKSTSERTYSAPFADHEYTRSIVTDEAQKKRVQRFLPLRYVQTGHFLRDTIEGLGTGILFAALLIGLHLWWRARSAHKHSPASELHSSIPWRTAYTVFALLSILLAWLYIMSFSYHVLGTDKVGGDLFYASLKSIRTGVLIGTLTTLVTLPLAVILGVSAGYFRGWVDDLIQYLYTTLSSIPGVLLIAAGVLMMQVMMESHPEWFASTLERSDLRLLFLIMILGVTSWTSLCRMLRAETLRIAQMDYVIAAQAFGVGRWRIMLRHIVPNLMHIILISVVLDFSGLVLAEAVLSYVGVGVDPTMYSWGNMINQARLEMAREPMVWWSLFSAFSFMFVLVLAANLFSDRVQQVLDPRSDA